MPLTLLRTKLISSGFHPEDVEYSILEVLQYKKAETLNSTDFNILTGILQKRKRNHRTHRVLENTKSYNCYFNT